MATAELVRKSPFELEGETDPLIKGDLVKKLITIAILGFFAYYVRLLSPANADLGYFVLGSIFFLLVLKDDIYGLVGIVFAIGMSPDSVGMNNVRFEDYLMPPIMLVWLLKKKAKGDVFSKSEVFTNVRIYMGIALFATIKGYLVGSIWTVSLAVAFYFKYLEYFLMMYLVFDIVRKKEDFLIVLLSALFTCSIVAFISYEGRSRVLEETQKSYVRASGPEGETPNVLGGYYLSHIMMAFALMFAVKNYIYRILIFGFLMAVIVPLLYTYSRTTFASMIVGLLITSLFIDMRFIGVLLILLFFQQILIPSIDNISHVDEHFVDRYSSIFNVFGSDGNTPSSWKARVVGWMVFYTKTWTYDPFFGMGVGSVGLGIDSSYVKKFAESGMIGFIAFMMLLIRLARMGMEVAKSNFDPFLKFIAIGYLGVLSSLSVHALGVCSFSTIRSAEPFWIFTGLMISVHYMMQKKEELMKEEAEDRENLRFSKWSTA